MSMTPPVKRRGAIVAAAVLSLSLVLAACGSDDDSASDATEEPTSETRTVEADNGTVEVPAEPRKVATIGNTTLPFIDLGGTPIGVTEEAESDVDRLPADQQETYGSATVLAASADEVDMEELAGLEPDLILVQIPDEEFASIEEELGAIAPTVFFGLDTEWKDLADGIAEAVGTTDALDDLKGQLEERVSSIQETYAEVIEGTSFVDVTRYDSSDPGTFNIADIGCSEIARDEVGMDFPQAAEGEDPLAYAALSFEQIGELDAYDVITYPVDAAGEPIEPFAPVVETNSWNELPAVGSGRALGVFCPGNGSYGPVLQYLDSLDAALATLPTEG